MNPGNDPEIPSLKPLTGKEEEKKGGNIVPSSAKPAPSSGFKFPGFGGGATGSKGFSAPNLKVRGLGGGGATVMDRLKNLRKKDLIFIAAGLCTLGMAPLAEHLLMSPEEQTAKLEEGFNRQQGPLFNEGGTVYEPGNGVGSPGGLVGSGSDVITPLNVRDPSNLIMSPGAQKKADAVVSAPPPTPGPAKGESDWKDVLRDSAKGGVSKAVQQSPKLPKPNVKMAGAIRGLSALGGGGGGTGASLKLDPLSASNVPNRAAGSNALTRSQATPGFRGATSRSGTSSGAGEDLRAAGQRQSDIFNKGGGASAALDAASREAIPTGGAGSGNGRPGNGDETKNPGGNSQKDNKSLGESLAFLRQKMEMEKSLDLKWERKKWNEFGRQKMMEESAIKLGFDMFGKFAEKAFIGPLADMVSQAVAPGPNPMYKCTVTNGGAIVTGTAASIAKQNFCVKAGRLFDGECKALVGTCVSMDDGSGGSNAGNPNSDPTNPGQVGRRFPGGTLPGINRTLEQVCSDVDGALGGNSNIPMGVKQSLKNAAQNLLQAKNDVNGSTTWGCGTSYRLNAVGLDNSTSLANEIAKAGSALGNNKKTMKENLHGLLVRQAGVVQAAVPEKSQAVVEGGLALGTAEGVGKAEAALTAEPALAQLPTKRADELTKNTKFDQDFNGLGPWMGPVDNKPGDTLQGNRIRSEAIAKGLAGVSNSLAAAKNAIDGIGSTAIAEVKAKDKTAGETVEAYAKALAEQHTGMTSAFSRADADAKDIQAQHDPSWQAYQALGKAADSYRVALIGDKAQPLYGKDAPKTDNLEALFNGADGVAAKMSPATLTPIKTALGVPATAEQAAATLKTTVTEPVSASFGKAKELVGDKGPVAQALTQAGTKIDAIKDAAPSRTDRRTGVTPAAAAQ